MQKTKLGIKVGALAMAIYVLALVNNPTALTILVGYVLLFEANPWLKKAALKAFTIIIIAALLTSLPSLINNILAIPNYIISWFDSSYDAFQLKVPLNLLNIYTRVISIIEFVLLAVCAIKAPKQGTCAFAPIDKIVEKIIVDDAQ